MLQPTSFEWDDAKSLANVVKHRLAFADAVAVFADPGVVVIDTVRVEDGEPRRKAIGVIGSSLFNVVFVMRGQNCRLISARRANAGEERAYG